MASKIILMMEEEQPEGLSARKLVAETAKHNVLTAYTADSGMALLRRFPKVDAVLVHQALLEDQAQADRRDQRSGAGCADSADDTVEVLDGSTSRLCPGQPQSDGFD